MRSKKLLSTVVASTLVATTMVVPVMAADGGGFDVTVTTKTPVIRVVVPTSMEVAVNQFEMGDAGSQIYSNAFEMENKSEIPVKLSVTSTATTPDDTTLVATKAEATNSTKDGEAWLAVAAQTSAGKYIEDSTKGIKDLTETSANVTTFADKKAEQTYYLNASTTMSYKLLNANESAADIEYAQFYELTAVTYSDDAGLKAALKDKDIYVIATSSIDDGATIAKVAEADTWASSNTYYTAAQTATAKSAIDTTKLYLYGDGTAAATGKAGFRYIGKLSGKQETWTDTDLSKISVAYSIVGVQQNTYDDLAGQTGVLTYGLYKAPSYLSATTMTTTSNSVTLSLPTGVTLSKVELAYADGTGAITLDDQYALNGTTFAVPTENIAAWLGLSPAYTKLVLTFSDNKTETITMQ